MNFHILTIFPEIFNDFHSTGLVGKAVEKNLISISTDNIRNYAEPPHYHVDDTPYGGGAGMVMRPEPLLKSIQSAKESFPRAKTILLSPSGTTFSQEKAEELSRENQLIFVCGRYEGVDQRVIDLAIDEEVSIGDYILMGGEIPVMVIIETISRLLPGVLGNTDSTEHESFGLTLNGFLEAPQYTRPPEAEGLTVPEVLLSGDHQRIAEWRSEQSKKRTEQVRPDLLKKRG